jgi:hypothetical protein
MPYAGFGRLVAATADGATKLTFCWSHTPRKFYDNCFSLFYKIKRARAPIVSHGWE